MKTTTKFKILGLSLLTVGVTLSLVGAINFFASMGTFGMPKLFWMCFLGIPMTVAGGVLTGIGFRPQLTKMGADIQSETMAHAGGAVGSAAVKTVEAVQPAISKTVGIVKEAINPGLETELRKLDELRAKNLITEEEYKKMRAKALDI